MHVISQSRIREAKAAWPREATALDRWYRLAKAARPDGFAALKATFPATDRVGRFYVFDIGGNKLRLIAEINFERQKLFIRHIMDHSQYDRWTP